MQKHPTKINLVTILKELPDPRLERRKLHSLCDVLTIALCAILCGAKSFEDMEIFGDAKADWFETFLDLPNGIPSHDTFNRVFAALDPQAFLESFIGWTQSLRAAVSQEIVALDGKALRRAINQGDCPKVIVSAWAAENGLTLGQLKVDDKSNEITAVPKLLRVLELSGCIVTLDAMGCQKEIAKEIKEADADYVLALKGNHGTAHTEIKSYLDDAIARKSPELAFVETVDKGHGRLEVRRYWQSGKVDWFADKEKWEGLQSIGVVEAVREIKGQCSIERRYYLSSLSVDVGSFGRAVRSHWSVENQLHWVMDMDFGEDQSRARSGNASENLATLRRWALNVIKSDQEKKKRSLKGRMKAAGWNNRYLLHLLGINLGAVLDN